MGGCGDPDGGSRRRGMTKPGAALTADTPSVDLLSGLTEALEPAFRLEHLVALSRERALYQAWDRMLKRFVALRVHLSPDVPGRAWFMRETETLAALDHPAIRHAYHAAAVGPFASRPANWTAGATPPAALRRGARPLPAAASRAR